LKKLWKLWAMMIISKSPQLALVYVKKISPKLTAPALCVNLFKLKFRQFLGPRIPPSNAWPYLALYCAADEMTGGGEPNRFGDPTLRCDRIWRFLITPVKPGLIWGFWFLGKNQVEGPVAGLVPMT
jgi:hypothetical protein